MIILSYYQRNGPPFSQSPKAPGGFGFTLRSGAGAEEDWQAETKAGSGKRVQGWSKRFAWRDLIVQSPVAARVYLAGFWGSGLRVCVHGAIG